MRTSSEQYNNPSGLIDRKIGELYETLETVKQNLTELKHVSFYMPQLFEIHQNIDSLLALGTSENAINFTNDNLGALSEYFSSLNTLITNRASLDALATEIQDNATKADSFANANENVEVEPGSYSSKHFSEKSKKYATNAEDVEVEPGKYSSLHYSLKSAQTLTAVEAIKLATEALKNDVSLSKDEVENLVTTVNTDISDAEESINASVAIAATYESDVQLILDSTELVKQSVESLVNQINNISGNYDTRALMEADLTPEDGSYVQVYDDNLDSNKGTYKKVGASGSGSWVQISSGIPAINGLYRKLGTMKFDKDSPNVLNNMALNSAGNAVNSSGKKVSDYIRILAGESFIITGVARQRIAFYDDNQNFIPGTYYFRDHGYATVNGYFRIDYDASIEDLIKIDLPAIKKTTDKTYVNNTILTDGAIEKVNLTRPGAAFENGFPVDIPIQSESIIGFDKPQKVNFFEEKSAESGYALSNNPPTKIEVSGFNVGGFVAVPPNTNMISNGPHKTAFFDASFKPVGSNSGDWLITENSIVGGEFVTHPSTVYMRTQVADAYKSTLTIVQGNVKPSPADSRKTVLNRKFIGGFVQPRFFNKKAGFVGDSQTAGIGDANSYVYYLNDLMGFSSYQNLAVGSSRVTNVGQDADKIMSQHYLNLDLDCDVIVFGPLGIADAFTTEGSPLGTINDTSNTTYYGALDTMFSGTVQLFESRVVSLRCIFSIPATVLATQENLKLYAEATEYMCKKYRIPFLNLLERFHFDSYQSNGVTLHPLMQDTAHLNEQGHEYLAQEMFNFING